jgi:NADH-quinone oxidoreductase subunit G
MSSRAAVPTVRKRWWRSVPDNPPVEMVTITLNGREIEAARGASLLHTCLDNAAPVPYFCDHRRLEPIGACRMCVVQIEKQPKLATACTVTVSEGMVVHTESEEVIKARQGVLEFLLINHPLDCPVCDKGGECDLQDFSFYHGPGKSRFIEEKLKYPKPVPLSDKILLDMERCVLCERCVRYFDEVTEEGQLVLLNRGVHTMIGTFNGEPMDSHFQGNIMELCPVGALTSADWRFSARPWDMRSTPSVCHGCSVGCNVQVQALHDPRKPPDRRRLAVRRGPLRFSFRQQRPAAAPPHSAACRCGRDRRVPRRH